MNVLMLSTDARIFEAGSAVAARMASYGGIADSIEIVVFKRGKAETVQLASNVKAVTRGGRDAVDAFLQGKAALAAAASAAYLISSQDPFFLGLLALREAKKNKIPFQAQLHTDCFSFAYAFESPRRLLEVILAFFVLKNASCIRVVSKRIEKSLRMVTRAPIAVLPIRTIRKSTDALPIPPEFKGRFTVVAVSRLTSEKQLHLLIDAIARTKEVDAVIVGDGPLRDRLEARAQSKGVADRVRFALWQDPHPYYTHADVFIQLSRYEGYGMALAEAACNGLPIITTDVGIVGEVFSRAEVSIVAPHALVVAEAIMALQASPELRKGLGEAARKKMEGIAVSESEYLVWYRKAFQACY